MSKPNHLAVESTHLPWQPTGTAGLESKTLHAGTDPRAPLQTQLLKLAADTPLPEVPVGQALEVLVLEGALTGGGEPLLPQGYAVLHDNSQAVRSDATGCSLFVRQIPSGAAPVPAWHPASSDPWLPGQGGLRVKPLGPEGGHGALVFWPAGERFQPHRHWGGEEIFVMSGTFQDEHGSYPAGTWMQSPHLSQHFPFVTDETVIFVKTGHLPIPS